MSIPHYTDHAANERTFLAWVRTAIAIMAFGFLVGKSDLLLRVLGHGTGQPAVAPPPGISSVASLGVIGLGALIVLLATVRFHRTGRQIEAETTVHARDGLALWLAGLIVVLGLALTAYVFRSTLGPA